MAFRVNGASYPDRLIDDELANLRVQVRGRLSEEEYAEVEAGLPLLARENVVARILVEEAAVEADPEVSYQEVQEEFERMLTHYGGPASFHARFNKNEADHQELREHIEKSLKVAHFLEAAKDVKALKLGLRKKAHVEFGVDE